MRQIRVLDCTLRDGGYINDFCFGRDVIVNLIDGLSKASIDIIECGFLRSDANDSDKTLFSSINAAEEYIVDRSPNAMYVVMIQYGAISEDEITDYAGGAIEGIRLTFHEHEIDDAFTMGQRLMHKGYKVFMQPVGTTTYTDSALLDLVSRINALKPYAFYIVDTLGNMYKKDLLRMFYILDNNLENSITLGFHSHNNLQMSFANAQELTQINSKRNLIIDASVLGMGRGAGNLNTELLVQYLNINQGLKYDSYKIMDLMDQYIKPLSNRYKWGYDAAYYLAAVADCHPNYASYLLNLQTMQIRDIGTILNALNPEKKKLYDSGYIESEYARYMDHHVDDSDVCQALRNTLGGKKILLLAPGKSLSQEIDKLKDMISTKEYYTVSVNFIPQSINVDMVFISNLKRFKNVLKPISQDSIRTVVTSNIENPGEGAWIVNYSSYLNEDSSIIDNAGLMCINLFKKIGAKEYLLAGFDGFSEDSSKNFYEETLYIDVEKERLKRMNCAIGEKIRQLRKQITIQFISASSYDA